ncbi:transglycosylase domain-containing protein [Flavobacteriaceae bacterium F89]|uniref:Transglycosylase domain-containing protein n=1 Tax=Cerina litoralis TaxID=2874477 RepID=A0AAE3ET90_9FLAO|nr:transglycosylase domain-containing protein [Cerina litoralis]MCG2459744.1 transglycosylase domain-containing protein [Cerina litoralis]
MIFRKIKSPYLRYGLIVFLAILGGLALFIFSIYIGIWGKIPDKKELSDFKYDRASEVYSADSVLIGKYYIYDRQPVGHEAFPQHLIDALVSIEDERFFDHSGVDYPSLARVAFKTILLQDRSSGGGSTLTQQLAKNLYPRRDRKKSNLAVDKIKEMIVASRLEDIYTKDEIITLYLNTVSFGDNTFGIESASLKFFNKRTAQLTVEEAATLVGMLKATYGYNPRIFPETSRNRRNLVLQSMYNNGYLAEKEKDSLSKLPVNLNYREYDYNDGLAPYFREEVRKQLLDWANVQKEQGNSYNIYTSGLKIYTTLDSKMQSYAEKAMKEHMQSLQSSFEKSFGGNAPWLKDKRLKQKTIQNSTLYKKLRKNGMSESQVMDSMTQKHPMTLTDWNGDKMVMASSADSLIHYMKFLNTGSMSLDPATGAVKTWIGGINFRYFKYDHVSQSSRQVGSTFKPIVYTAALESGIPPCTYFSAQEVSYKNMKDWTPGNAENKDEAYLNYSMQEALSKSVNTVAVKVLEKTGIPTVLEQAKKMGITSELPAQPSLALGTGEIKLNELAGAYASYVNKGKPVKPYLIQAITNDTDSILQTFKPEITEKPAFSEETGTIMLQFLKATVNSGTAARLRSTHKLQNDMAGKTGTTQNNKDAWFVALTPKLVHVTWVGLDNHEIGFNSTRLGQGANAALPIFALWMQQLNKNHDFDPITRAKFPKPDVAILKKLDCDPIKKDGFFKRLFKNPNKVKSRKFKTTN